MSKQASNSNSVNSYATQAAQAAQAAHLVYIDERGAAEGKAQEATNKAVQAAAEAMHAGSAKLTPKAVGAAILKAVKALNDKAERSQQVPASRISRALKAVHIEGWTEEGKGCAVRVHRSKDTAADIVADFVGKVAQTVEKVNSTDDLDKIEKAVLAAIRAKRQAITSAPLGIDDVMIG